MAYRGLSHVMARIGPQMVIDAHCGMYHAYCSRCWLQWLCSCFRCVTMAVTVAEMREHLTEKMDADLLVVFQEARVLLRGA